MLRYIIRRLLYAIPILIGVSLATFLLFNVISTPEQIARKNISQKNPTREQIQEWLKDHDYDKPLHVRFMKHMTELSLFRFGKSDATGEDIWKRIKEGVGPSVTLMSRVRVAGTWPALRVALLAASSRGTYIDAWGLSSACPR